MRKEQLCWNCTKTSAEKCEWFRTTERHPDYCTVDEDNFIVECEEFEKIPSRRRKEYPNSLIAERLGISIRTFYRNKEHYTSLFFEKLAHEFDNKRQSGYNFVENEEEI